MKTFHRSIIILVSLTAYINLILLFKWPISEGVFSNDSIIFGDLSLVFILALAIGSLVAGILLYKLNPIWLIISGLFFTVASLGGYTLANELNQLFMLRVFHGGALSLILTSSLYSIYVMTTREAFIESTILLGKVIIGASILLIPLKEFVVRVSGHQWLIFISIFVTVFTATLVTLLSKYAYFYIRNIRVKTDTKTNSNIVNILNALLGGTISALTLGIFIYTFDDMQLSNLSLSEGVVFYMFFFSMLVIFSSKIIHITKYIGSAKALCSGLLLLALNISLITIFQQSALLLIPIALAAIAFSLIISASFYCISEIGFNRIKLSMGFFMGVMFFGFLIGYTMAEYNNGEAYSPLILNSIVLISSSILFIRRIHQGGQVEI